MGIQVKTVMKNNNCYISFSHNFNSMRKTKQYIKTLKESVQGSDTKVETTLYINTLKTI